jgi:hypothetical protein
VNAGGVKFSATVGATTFPAGPTNLKASTLASNEIQLTWTPVTGATGYVVELYYNNAWHIVSQGGNSNSYYSNITNLTRSASYYVIVGAYNASGTTFSSELYFTMPG